MRAGHWVAIAVATDEQWGALRAALGNPAWAAEPALAQELYERVCSELRGLGLRVETGRFRAMMQVHSIGDGPVTILLDSEKQF